MCARARARGGAADGRCVSVGSMGALARSGAERARTLEEAGGMPNSKVLSLTGLGTFGALVATECDRPLPWWKRGVAPMVCASAQRT